MWEVDACTRPGMSYEGFGLSRWKTPLSKVMCEEMNRRGKLQSAENQYCNAIIWT